MSASTRLEKYVNKKVSKILDKINEVLLLSPADILSGDTDSLIEKLKNYGSTGFQKAIESTTNEEQKTLFGKLKSVDDGALNQTSTLEEGDTNTLAHILCKMFGAKVRLIRDYIKQQRESKKP